MRLALLGCSLRKRPDVGLLPAVERYDGPIYRVLRAYQRTHTGVDDLRIAILSAEFGVLAGTALVAWYDRRMTPDRAADLESTARTQWHALLDTLPPVTALFVNLGRDYAVLGATVLNAEASRLPAPVTAHGGYGDRMGQLKRWLEGDR